MKIIVDLINKSFKVLENEKNIYVGNNNADVLKLYCYNGGYHLENEFVSITGLLSNGRKIGPFTTDSAYDEEYIDGKLHTLAKFTLTKQNGFTLSEGQLNITVWYNKTNDSGAIVSKQAIGNLLFNVVKTTNVDENIIITDASGDVIYNFKLEIENIQSAVNSINSSFVKFKQHTEESIMRLEDNKADLEVMWDAFDNYSEQIPYGDRKFAWLLNFTGDSLLIDMINELNSRDLFVDDKGKFWVEIGLENPTVIEDIRITKQKKPNGYFTGYGINSIIRSGTTIRVFMKSVAKDSTMTINEFIDLHKQVAVVDEIPTKVSQLENDNGYISLETLNDTKDELREYADNKVANLVNSAPSTLDTLGELAAALEDNKEVVEVLNEAIGNKADITYVDEKVANAGVPSDLLDRVETLETLSEEAVYMEDTEFDVEEETGGSVGGSTSGTPSKTYQELTGPFFNNGEVLEIYGDSLSDTYTIIDLTNDDQAFSMAQVEELTIDLTHEDTYNATVIIKIPDDLVFNVGSMVRYVRVNFASIFIPINTNSVSIEGWCLNNDYVLFFPLYENSFQEIRIEFDERGIAKTYCYTDWEV